VVTIAVAIKISSVVALLSFAAYLLLVREGKRTRGELLPITVLVLATISTACCVALQHLNHQPFDFWFAVVVVLLDLLLLVSNLKERFWPSKSSDPEGFASPLR